MRALVVVLLLQSGCWSLGYLAKQAVGELKLLHARRRISEVLADPTVDAHTKERLALAWQARQFGVSVLGLKDGNSFTRYLDTGGRPVAWNLSAARKDELKPLLKRFPVTGAVPYLGFFSEADARREQERLIREDYDTYVRPVSGFSTLGLTADPIYSSMLEGSPAHVVEVVLHEMLHTTVYLAGHTDWNESLASVVGFQGAVAFFAAREGAEGARRVMKEAQARHARQRAFTETLEPILRELEALYAAPLSRLEKLARRDVIFARAREQFRLRFPPPPGKPPSPLSAQPLNNAVLIAFAVYHRGEPEHERVLALLHGNLPAFVRLYKTALERDHPLDWLRARTK